MAFVLISAGVDLSAGRIVGLAAVITASLGQTMEYGRRFYPQLGNIPIIVPFLAAVIVTSLLGFFNGFVIAKFKIVPFIVTLGTQIMAWGINLLYFDIPPNKSQPIGGVKPSITYFGSGLIKGLGIPIIIIIALIICAICWFILSKLRFGRNVYAVGGNQESAMVSGIRVDLNLIGVYTLAGALYGIAGFLECSRTGGATSAYGLNYEFDAISACVVGGVSNTGGIGTIPGMILGVLVFGIINYGLTFIGVNPYWQNIIKGLIIIAAVGFDIRKNIRRK
jgi:methyl-galactoside transport system permease protein